MKLLLLFFCTLLSTYAQDYHAPLAGNSNALPQWGSNLNTIVVFIKFQGDADFTGTRSSYESNFNSATSSSLKLYYKEVSYNKIDISSYLFPVATGTINTSYSFPKPRGYFMNYSGSNTIGYQSVRDARLREHEILDSAVTAIKGSVPEGLQFDFNNDGMVDNVMFIFQGSAGPWADVGLW
ncbi:MAG: hypothetical protein HYV28_16575, partial [Ignavibacteriales bacterium]|nr:hypothetical protein [Ignavibacteriales bacterium]